jgi:hypothetical protein
LKKSKPLSFMHKREEIKRKERGKEIIGRGGTERGNNHILDLQK